MGGFTGICSSMSRVDLFRDERQVGFVAVTFEFMDSEVLCVEDLSAA